MNKRIDIIVAVHNGENIIKGCLDALLKTSYKHKRIIIINDASTDATLDILKGFNGKIVIINNEKNEGVSLSRNKGISFSDADFIAMTDADCKVDPEWIDNSIAYFRDKNVAAVTGWLHYEVTNTISAVREAEYFVRFNNRKNAATVSCPIVIFRRDVLREIGGFEPSYKVGGEDTDLGYKISEKGYKIVYEPEMVAYHKAETCLKLYIIRNFRNGYNHLKMAAKRRKINLLRDDFFSPVIRFQSVATILLLSSFILFLIFKSNVYLLTFFVSLSFLMMNYIPILIKTVDLKGVVSLPLAFFILLTRNVVWIFALLFGLYNIIWRRLTR